MTSRFLGLRTLILVAGIGGAIGSAEVQISTIAGQRPDIAWDGTSRFGVIFGVGAIGTFVSADRAGGRQGAEGQVHGSGGCGGVIT